MKVNSRKIVISRLPYGLILFASAFSFMSTQVKVAGIPLAYLVPFVGLLWAFVISGQHRITKLGACILILWGVGCAVVLTKGVPSQWFYWSFGVFSLSLLTAYFLVQVLASSRLDLSALWGIGFKLLIFCFLLSVGELLLPEAFDTMRSSIYSSFDAPNAFTPLEAHFRRIGQFNYYRPHLFFTEPSNYAKFLAVILMGMSVNQDGRKPIITLSLMLVFFLLVRSPSVLIPAPLLIVKYYQSKRGLPVLSTVLLGAVLVMIALYSYNRFSLGVTLQMKSELERVILPATFLVESPSVLFFGAGPGNTSYLGEYICKALSLDLWQDVDCLKNPPSAFNSIFGWVYSYGLFWLFLVWLLTYLIGCGREMIAVYFSMIVIGSVMAGYNMPKFLILVYLNSALLMRGAKV